MNAKILWIEGKRAGVPHFAPALRRKGFVITIAMSGAEALARIEEVHPEIVVLNAASMRTTGTRICQALNERANGIPVVVISDPEHPVPKDICADVVLCLPFTARKLVNRIKSFLPGKAKKVYEVGVIRLDVEGKKVSCLERETHLNPRLTSLLRMFLEHPGEVLTREELFKAIWETDYLDDTRTLDVHISWLRKAIEPDPGNPQFIKTIRGIGYRLDV